MNKNIIIGVIIIVLLLLGANNISSQSIKYQSNLKNSDDKDEYNIGDLIFCDIKKDVTYLGLNNFVQPDKYNDHCAMYIGNGEIIHSVPIGGVITGKIDNMKLWAKNIIYAKVDVDQDIRNEAVDWAIERSVAKDTYQFDYRQNANHDPYDTEDKYSNKWYCCELLWAAYYNVTDSEIDIDDAYYNGETTRIIWIDEILIDDNVSLYDYFVPELKCEIIRYYKENWLTVNFDISYSDLDGSSFIAEVDYENDGIIDETTFEGNANSYCFNFVHTYDSIGEYSTHIKVTDDQGLTNETVINFELIKNIKTTVETPVGPTDVNTRDKYTYSVHFSDPDSEELYIRFYFTDDPRYTDWYGPYSSPYTKEIDYIWEESPCLPSISAQVKDEHGGSVWSQSLDVNIMGKNRFLNFKTLFNQIFEKSPFLDFFNIYLRQIN